MKAFSLNQAFATIVIFFGLTLQSLAVNPSEILSDPALEARARSISAELRCLVCQNQSIDSSDAELAKDLRVLVREHLKAGETDAQIYDFLVARYGEFVLLKPRFETSTILLWLTPAFLLLLGSMTMLYHYKKTHRDKNLAELSDSEKEQLDKLISRQ